MYVKHVRALTGHIRTPFEIDCRGASYCIMVFKATVRRALAAPPPPMQGYSIISTPGRNGALPERAARLPLSPPPSQTIHPPFTVPEMTVNSVHLNAPRAGEHTRTVCVCVCVSSLATGAFLLQSVSKAATSDARLPTHYCWIWRISWELVSS